MKRRRILAAFAALTGAAVAPRILAQPPRPYRVGILTYGSKVNFQTRADAFFSAMRALGYEDGRNVRYQWTSANGQDDLLQAFARDMARDPPDVVLSGSALTTRVLQRATKTIPIVMAAAEDPVLEGFVKSLAQPGTNITGISASVLDHLPRHLDILMEVSPRIRRIVALLNPANATYGAYRARLEAAIRPPRRLAVIDARDRAEIDRVFDRRARAEEVEGLVVMNDPMFYTERRTIAEGASRLRQAAIYPLRGFVEAGGLMSWGPNPEASFIRAATFVDRILKGGRPAEIAVEPAPRIELVLNRDAARSIGLTLPPDLLKQAATVID
ncbi:MAG TPA: ABC transporter substrate-binding protein [Usitatibacter sp.]|nr:ABC transporter substrate-binding protein [Usitatibacter sp.]